MKGRGWKGEMKDEEEEEEKGGGRRGEGEQERAKNSWGK